MNDPSQMTQPNPPLPKGAVRADGFVNQELHPDPYGERCVDGPEYVSPSGARVIAHCWQRADGSIVGLKDSLPSVTIDFANDMPPTEADDFARAVHNAAELAQDWLALVPVGPQREIPVAWSERGHMKLEISGEQLPDGSIDRRIGVDGNLWLTAKEARWVSSALTEMAEQLDGAEAETSAMGFAR